MKGKVVLIIAVILLLVSIASCKEIYKGILYNVRKHQYASLGDDWTFYNAIYRKEPDKVRNFLEKGADPNYCRGECGWIDSNPLAVVTETFYDTYYRRKRGEQISYPTPDVENLYLLLEYGADIHQRPYIWDRVYKYNNRFKARLEDAYNQEDKTEYKELCEEIKVYVDDSNRLIRAFLEAGADPDMLGHPKPYETLYGMTDKKAAKYFAVGTRAINEAIRKGMIWESQVDLLLEYTSLDENSLKAAEESRDEEMIEKINNLWENQNSISED